MDVVVTVPKGEWAAWIAEGDLPGQPWSGNYSYFSTSSRPGIRPGERVYIVAHGKLRGYAPLVHLQSFPEDNMSDLIRTAKAVAVSILEPIPGFRGFRYRWWEREDEFPFPNWMQP